MTTREQDLESVLRRIVFVGGVEEETLNDAWGLLSQNDSAMRNPEGLGPWYGTQEGDWKYMDGREYPIALRERPIF